MSVDVGGRRRKWLNRLKPTHQRRSGYRPVQPRSMVPKVGFEPTLPFRNRILSAAAGRIWADQGSTYAWLLASLGKLTDAMSVRGRQATWR